MTDERTTTPPMRERDDLTALRLRAEQLLRDEEDEEFLGSVDDLRSDSEWWPHLWAPSAAIASDRIGRPGGLDLLREAAAGGFSQPEVFEGEIEARFSADPAWPALAARIAGNVPPPPLVLTDWPDPAPTLALTYDAIASERLEELRARLPEPVGTAWETATGLLAWARRSWEHANDHVSSPDAVEVLDRVAAGERFACVEYSIVLSQALNAANIPARRVSLRQANQHAGFGRGHVVSEAWLDDLDRWVLLDGQNGAFWVDADDRPLGARELQRRYRAGEPTRMIGLVDEISALDRSAWFSYFASASTTGLAWADPGFSPVFQSSGLLQTDRLLHDGDAAYPALSAIVVGLDGEAAQPVLRLSSPHPYATGFRVSEGGAAVDIGSSGARWPFVMTPGEHRVSITALTPYGETAPGRLEYRVTG